MGCSLDFLGNLIVCLWYHFGVSIGMHTYMVLNGLNRVLWDSWGLGWGKMMVFECFGHIFTKKMKEANLKGLAKQGGCLDWF